MADYWRIVVKYRNNLAPKHVSYHDTEHEAKDLAALWRLDGRVESSRIFHVTPKM